jgi:outer membrane protein OmpA-like peptidoglycan-associated protein
MRPCFRSLRLSIAAVVLVFAALVLPAPAGAARSFLCTFDTDSDALDSRCNQIAREFVDYWMAAGGRTRLLTDGTHSPNPPLRVSVVGGIDTAEETRRQHIVGERRARAVAEALIAAGIPRAGVRVRNLGARLLQPTGPNVSERWNRRVEITLHSGSEP